MWRSLKRGRQLICRGIFIAVEMRLNELPIRLYELVHVEIRRQVLQFRFWLRFRSSIQRLASQGLILHLVERILEVVALVEAHEAVGE